MRTPFDFKAMGENLVYVKTVPVDTLPREVRENAGDATELFAVHDAKGRQLALVTNRNLAFALARENDLVPMAVH